MKEPYNIRKQQVFPGQRPGQGQTGSSPGQSRPGQGQTGSPPGQIRPGQGQTGSPPGQIRPGQGPPGIPPGQTRPGQGPSGTLPGFPPGQTRPGTQPQVPPGQAGRNLQPPSSPPNFTPEMPQAEAQPFAGRADARRPGGGIGIIFPGFQRDLRGCINRFTYIWLINGSNFWFYPIFAGRRTVEGFRWRRNAWVYDRINTNRILFFRCF